MAISKIPMRMCAACRKSMPKNQLLRIIRTPNGEVILAQNPKQNGRGVYICKNKECLAIAKKRNALGKSLDCEISHELYDKISEVLDGVAE